MACTSREHQRTDAVDLASGPSIVHEATLPAPLNFTLLGSVTHSAGLRDSHTAGLCDSHTAGLCDSHTAGLCDSLTAGLRDSHTAGLRDSHTVGLCDSHTAGLCDSLTAGLCDSHTAGLCGSHTAGLCDSPTAGLCDSHTAGLCDIGRDWQSRATPRSPPTRWLHNMLCATMLGHPSTRASTYAGCPAAGAPSHTGVQLQGRAADCRPAKRAPS
eukprot:359613-Chlamydomonas_euryale.AAC.7